MFPHILGLTSFCDTKILSMSFDCLCCFLSLLRILLRFPLFFTFLIFLLSREDFWTESFESREFEEMYEDSSLSLFLRLILLIYAFLPPTWLSIRADFRWCAWWLFESNLDLFLGSGLWWLASPFDFASLWPRYLESLARMSWKLSTDIWSFERSCCCSNPSFLAGVVTLWFWFEDTF